MPEKHYDLNGIAFCKLPHIAEEYVEVTHAKGTTSRQTVTCYSPGQLANPQFKHDLGTRMFAAAKVTDNGIHRVASLRSIATALKNLKASVYSPTGEIYVYVSSPPEQEDLILNAFGSVLNILPLSAAFEYSALALETLWGLKPSKKDAVLFTITDEPMDEDSEPIRAVTKSLSEIGFSIYHHRTRSPLRGPGDDAYRASKIQSQNRRMGLGVRRLAMARRPRQSAREKAWSAIKSAKDWVQEHRP